MVDRCSTSVDYTASLMGFLVLLMTHRIKLVKAHAAIIIATDQKIVEERELS